MEVPALSDVLARILARKREEVAAAQASQDLASLRRDAEAATDPVRRPRGFARRLGAAIAAGQAGVIAEMKQCSPSTGALRTGFHPPALAANYAGHGAACLSVLTDAHFFGGSLEHLKLARAGCALPVLRKDFIIDPWQVYQARAWGADCILLIVAALDPLLMAELEWLALSLGMDVLVEAHDARELDAALALGTPLVGINNRDLRTLSTSVQTTLHLCSRIPPGKLAVSESGIRTHEDVAMLRSAGVHAYLVGETFLRAADPGAEMARLFGTRPGHIHPAHHPHPAHQLDLRSRRP